VDKIYGFPLSVDSLALFYNKDLLSAAGIATPPDDWTEFLSDVEKLTQYDDAGNIKQSGAAIGTADNVERATDILSLLMIQNGTQMTDDQGRVAFHLIPDGTPADIFPGLDAVEFYTDFSDPTKKAYAWNTSMPSSFEAFTTGKTAFFFGYSYHLPLIRTAAPKLNFAVSGMPQIAGGKVANFANYWVEGVSKDTKNADWAWDFLAFAASQKQVSSYLAAASKPTALRNLINTQLESEDLNPFASQVLTAESWYHGLDVSATDKAFKNLITAIAANPEKPEKALTDAAKKVSQTY
jgi:multiple sugar transport system substrate-binding protein